MDREKTLHYEEEILSFVSASGMSLLSCSNMHILPAIKPDWIASAFSATVLIPEQKSTPAPENPRTPEELDSPPYSPTPSCTERPRIPSTILAELKQSCAILVTDTNPPTDEYDQPAEHQDALRKYKEQQAAKKRAQARAAEKASKKEQESFSSRRPRKESADAQPKPAPYRHIPKNAASDFENTAIPRRPSQSYRPDDNIDLEPLEPYHTKTSANGKEQNIESDDPLYQIRAQLNSRPKTSAAACIDYTGPSVDTSNSTSRSNTTYDSHGRPLSTGVTSINLTPGDEKRSSYTIPNQQRVSEQILHDGASASLADATAKAWMMQELARRRAEYKAGPARPGSRSSYKPSASASMHEDRPPSRAGSIARSVADGVREYVRPRASMDSVRSTRSENSNLSRSSSRNRRDSNGGWRAQLRRRGSFSSWRNNKPATEDSDSPNHADGAVNLNRELPALPGLDQYKEKKAKPTHIAQIMRPAARACKTEKAKPVTMSTFHTSSILPLSPAEEQRRQMEIRRAVDAKMGRATTGNSGCNPSLKLSPQLGYDMGDSTYSPQMQSPRSAPGYGMAMGQYNAGLKAPTFKEMGRTQSQPVMPSVRVPAAAVGGGSGGGMGGGVGGGMGEGGREKGGTESKKPSLRKRLSRFWSSGGREKMVVAAAN